MAFHIISINYLVPPPDSLNITRMAMAKILQELESHKNAQGVEEIPGSLKMSTTGLAIKLIRKVISKKEFSVLLRPKWVGLLHPQTSWANSEALDSKYKLQVLSQKERLLSGYLTHTKTPTSPLLLSIS